MKTGKKYVSRLRFLPVTLFLLMITPTLVAGQEGRTSATDSTAIQGRWDLTVYKDGKAYPSWLEIRLSGSEVLVGRFVGMVGSARPISRINFVNGKMSFSIPPQWHVGSQDLHVEGVFQDDRFKGTLTTSKGETYNWAGVRAPLLNREEAPVWGKPISLLGEGDLSQWHALGDNQWTLEAGILKSAHTGANLVTNESFRDFKLHIEVRFPEGSNSGIYLRGRYEVQVVDSKGQQPSDLLFGAVYGFLPPNDMVAKAAGEWQVLDITLIGRLVTVVANGRKIICNQVIPGITGGALNSREDEPGPILLQGDHGPVAYRNITITPAL